MAQTHAIFPYLRVSFLVSCLHCYRHPVSPFAMYNTIHSRQSQKQKKQVRYTKYECGKMTDSE